MKLNELPKPVYDAVAENVDISQFIDSEIKPQNYPIRLSELLTEIASASSTRIIGKYSLDCLRKSLSTTENKISLTEKEISIIIALIDSPYLKKDDLLNKVWGYSKDADTNTLETHIYRLRQKILDNFGEELILSENGKYSIKK